MERIFSDATPEQEQAFVEERRKSAFLAACRWPLSWLISACHHKRAADILYEIAFESNERELSQFMTEAKGGISASRTLDGQELLDSLNIELIGDYYLLAGYAIECVLKGYLLALRPELVNDEKQLDKLIFTHNLCKLCKECAIVLTQEEQDILNLITQHLIWRKYAAPKKVDDMPSWVDPDNDKKKWVNIGDHFYQKRAQLLVNGVFQKGLDLLNSMRDSQP